MSGLRSAESFCPEAFADPLHVFAYDDLPDAAQSTGRHFYELARWLVSGLPDTPQRAAALSKLFSTRNYAIQSEPDRT